MPEHAFKELRSQVFALYDQGAFAEALSRIDEKLGSFPDFECDLFFWRACLACRLGDPEAAIRALRRAAERGHWYHERMLRDPDLDPIRSSEALVELLGLFRERYERAQREAKPQREVYDPQGEPDGLLLALHGAGGSILTEGDSWRRATELGWRVALLQSSQLMAPGRYHWQDAGKAVEELQEHVQALGAPPQTVLAGYSMGAGLAIRAVLGGTVRALGFFAVAPSVRMETVTPLLARAPRGIRGYIVVGKDDTWSYEPARQLAAVLHESGVACTVEEQDGLGHDYPAAFLSSLERGLAFLKT